MAMNFHDYPYTDLHEMNLDWCIAKVKELTEAWLQTRQDWEDTQQAWEDMKTYINNYFDNLNVQTEINNKIDALVSDGTLSDLIAPYVASGLPAVVADQISAVVAAQIGDVVAAQISAVVAAQLPEVVATETAGQAAAWLETHVDPETGYVIDDSLTIQGAAADAKATGDAISDLNNALTENINYATFPNNLVNPSECKNNTVVVWSTGIESSDNNYLCTGFIAVTEGTTYKSNVGRNHVWFDSSKVYISGSTGTGIQSGITAPEGAAYVRFNISKVSDTFTSPYMIYFTDVAHFTRDVVYGINIPQTIDNKINPLFEYGIRGYQYPNNLVVVNDCVYNTYIVWSNGLEASGDNYFCTGFIPVVAGTTYKANKGRNHAWYNSSKVYISGASGAGIQSGITAPEGAAYIRFTINKTSDALTTPMLLYFTSVANYVSNTIIDGLDLYSFLWTFGKKINWIGDSIVAGQDFDEAVTDKLGMVETDYGINGSTIALKADGTDGRNAVCARYSDMTNDTDVVAVSCGTNDWMYAWCPIGTIDDADDATSNNTFYGALKTLCKGLITKYPQKTIFFTTPIKRGQAFTNGDGGTYTPDNVMTTPFSKNKYGKTLGDYAEIIKEVCALYSIPVLDLYNESMLNPSITAQQDLFDELLTHPNANGIKLMARRVCGWLTQLSFTI